jgi:hypothetical protein
MFVEGTVFVDADSSGYFHSPDAVLGGDTVSLENSGGTELQTTSSNSSGAYSFAGLAPGTYKVAIGEPLGYGSSGSAVARRRSSELAERYTGLARLHSSERGKDSRASRFGPSRG